MTGHPHAPRAERGRSAPPVYPVGLLVEGAPCVVVGGGPVGERKVRGLLEAGARVSVISPELTPGLKELHEANRIGWAPRAYRPGDESGVIPPPGRDAAPERPLLIIAATSDPAVNAAVCSAAAAAGVLASRADPPREDGQAGAGPAGGGTDQPAAGDDRPAGGRFIAPAVLRRGDVCVAVFTGGDSPGLAARIRDEVAAAIGPEYGELAELLRAARAALRRRVADPAARRRAMAALVSSPEPLRLLRAGARQEAVAWIARTVDEALARDSGEAPVLDPAEEVSP